ncbi:uncharacterized protein LOC130591219 [Beta vulgaris subsp. vulgaris]|uniref:uncharacterized protein LOC130591219 n=1 Tax=Beta vulgaris subsp. vulgaris TaxID=3555 RepID=UPI0025480E84|nr:uncharacterized protein LOC130591219 [Beta vulgaris subsp. vulgaris]
MARFWWGSSDSQRKIHWKKWDSMCTLKCLGGMGFKDLSVFNDALLGRQAWRHVHAPHSLFGHVMKAKYFPKCDFLEASMGYSCSYSWKSIWSSKALLKDGCIWRVGSGERINVWTDPWVASDEGRFISSDPIVGVEKVSDLIDSCTHEWKVNLIEESFQEKDVKSILAIPLSFLNLDDEVTWALTKNGHYSVKTAYMLGKGGNLDSFHQAWVDIWSMEASPKGCGAAESTSHAVFECPRVYDVWVECGCAEMCIDASSLSMCDLVESWRKLDRKKVIRGIFLAWCLWGERNRWIFQQQCTPNKMLVERVSRLADEYGSYTARIYNHVAAASRPSVKTWQPPPPGVIKLNVDASCADVGWTGLGVVGT